MSFLSGLFPFLRNNAEKFEEWTVKVGKKDSDAEGNIDILNRDKLTDMKNYKAELADFSKDYIAIIDNDDDGKISYDEFEKYNLQEAKDNLSNVTEEQLNEYKQTLKTIYDRLNIDNENESKDNLDIREVMNYFFTMDQTNENTTVNGNISQYEFETCNGLLADKGLAGEKFAKCVKYYFEHFFKKQSV